MSVSATLGRALDGSPALMSVLFDLASVGYSTHEHLVTGTASSYSPTGAWQSDGRWDVEPSSRAEFTTRVVVYRPADPDHGNGTVIVEWLNVTGGLDVPAVWMACHRHLVRDGYTWVGVSAQQASVEGGGFTPGLGLRQTVPDRYRTLDHPGDAYSFDVYTTIARALRRELPKLHDVRVDRMYAVGASQSAIHLTTYVNAVDGAEAEYDGFLMQGRAGVAAPVEGWSGASGSKMVVRRDQLAGRDRIRDDVRAPVMVVQSETDVLGALGYLEARQADNERFRLWEVAGAAHCDAYFMSASPRDSGSLSGKELAGLIESRDGALLPTALPMNAGPQMHYVLERAVDALDQWVRDGHSPPSAPRLTVGDDGAFVLDDVGMACGGVRTPWVDVPVAVLSGLGQPGYMTDLFGTTQVLDAEMLYTLYPGGRREYVEQFRGAARATVDAGFFVPADLPEIEELGAASWPDT